MDGNCFGQFMQLENWIKANCLFFLLLICFVSSNCLFFLLICFISSIVSITATVPDKKRNEDGSRPMDRWHSEVSISRRRLEAVFGKKNIDNFIKYFIAHHHNNLKYNKEKFWMRPQRGTFHALWHVFSNFLSCITADFSPNVFTQFGWTELYLRPWHVSHCFLANQRQ